MKSEESEEKVRKVLKVLKENERIQRKTRGAQKDTYETELGCSHVKLCFHTGGFLVLLDHQTAKTTY